MLRMLHKSSAPPVAPAMLNTTSAPQFSPVKSTGKRQQHVGINCDHCKQTDIVGVRYKCSCCPDFDLCSICMDTFEAELVEISQGYTVTSRSAVSIATHTDTTHLFYRIGVPVNSQEIRPAVKNRSRWVHSGVECSVCRSNVVGFRYFCTSCAVSLCESCEQKGSHRLDHNLLKMAPSQAVRDEGYNVGDNFGRK